LGDETYAQQKAVLDARSAKLGASVDVGEHTMCWERESNEVLFSYCIWTQGRDALLPAADYVVFCVEETILGQMHFDEVQRRYSGLMEATDDDPRRWRVRSFPSGVAEHVPPLQDVSFR
jgi:hypothetical protein